MGSHQRKRMRRMKMRMRMKRKRGVEVGIRVRMGEDLIRWIDMLGHINWRIFDRGQSRDGRQVRGIRKLRPKLRKQNQLSRIRPRPQIPHHRQRLQSRSPQRRKRRSKKIDKKL
jgi:hypothetical protein